MAAHVGLFAGGLLLGAGSAWLVTRETAPPPAVVPRAGASAPQASAVAPTAHGALALSGAPTGLNDVLSHEAYVSSYDRRLRHPAWTAEHLTSASLQRREGVDRGKSVFTEDLRIPEAFRSTNAAYFRSGYDRGHMVPAADAKATQTGMNETFLLSNIAPQVGEGMNRDYWAHTEDFVRRLTARFSDVYVFTVPLYLPRQSADGKWRVSYEVIGSPPSVSVPTHFAKVILGVANNIGFGQSKSFSMGAFVIPNSMIPDSAPLRGFETDGACSADQSPQSSAPQASSSSPRRSRRRRANCATRSRVRSSCATLARRTSASRPVASRMTRSCVDVQCSFSARVLARRAGGAHPCERASFRGGAP